MPVHFSVTTVFQIIGFLAALAVIAIAGFQLDSLVASPRKRKHSRTLVRFSNGMDENGNPMFVEPDGRTLRPGRKHA